MGRLIAVVGARGGVGATTVATNLAWTLAHEHNMRVALVDLDLFFGTCGLALDLELGRGFREALENPARIDSLFIERAMVREGENPRWRLQLRSVGADVA
jgi:pilus assembly protein CpaE